MVLKKLIKKIEKGKIDEGSLLELAKEGRLLEVYEGKTIIDYILEYKRNTEEFDKYAIYNPEIAIKYLDYGLKLNIDNEEILMSKYDDEKTIFEKYIEKHFDSLFLNIISGLIKDGKNLKEILSFKIDNKYIFEHLEEKGLNTIITYMMAANDKRLALDLIEKYDILLSYVYKKEVLIEKTNGETILSRLFRMNIENEEVVDDLLDSLSYDCFSLEYVFDDLNIIEYLEDTPLESSIWFKIFRAKYYYDYEFNESYISIDFISMIFANTTILDLIIMSNLDVSNLDGLAKTDLNIASIYAKNHKWEALVDINEDILLKSIGNKTLLEYLYEEFVFDENYPLELRNRFLQNLRTKVVNKGYYEKFIASIAFKYNDFETALKNTSFLLSKSGTDTYLDIVIKKLLDSNNIQAICSINYDLLVYKSKYLDNKMIIEYILDNFEEKFRKDLVTSEMLVQMLDEGITLLDFLIKKYRDVILKWVKESNIFSDLKVASILKANGIIAESIDISLDEKDAWNIVLNYEKKDFIRRSFKDISDEENELIDYFYDLMTEDGNSDKEIVELACASFKEQFSNGFEYAYRDLQTLIEIKNRYPNFALTKGQGSTFKNQKIIIDENDIYNIDAFNHEMTHAIHFFIASYNHPFSYEKYSILNTEQTRKIIMFSRMFKSKIREFVKKDLLQISELINTRHYYESYYDEVKDAFIKAKKDKTFPDEYIDFLTDFLLTFEEFENAFKNNENLELKYELASLEFGPECELEDLFDALSKGYFHSYSIELNGKIEETLDIGHGANYYKSVAPFIEIIANYMSIIKSPRKEECVAILKDVMGQEFIDMLDEFYANLYFKDLDYKFEGTVNKY